MTITWLGHACFALESGAYRIVTDPWREVPGFGEMKTEADAVYCSHGHYDHAATETVTLRNGGNSPFTVTEVSSFHDKVNGAKRGENAIRIFGAEGIRVAHLGDLGHLLDEAQTAFRAFYNVESKNMMREEREKIASALEKIDFDGTEIDEELLGEIPEEEMSAEEKEAIAKALMAEKVYKPAEVYVKKADESKEMFSTAITFLVFAALLLVFLVLNAMNIITMFNNAPSMALIGAMSIGCCLVGINAIKRSRNAEIASVEEEKLTASLENWLDENITDELFDELKGEDLSEEILYLRRTEIIKKRLNADYPDLDENYADELIEEFYNKRFANEDAEPDESAEDGSGEESAEEN